MSQNENSGGKNQKALEKPPVRKKKASTASKKYQIEQTKEDRNTQDPVSINSKSPIENMEVHAHSHTARQKWTHYFWEFFMLFLAVSAGFFTENMREHYIEHHRAEQYASFLYNDLVKDTVILKGRTEFMQMGNKKLDTLIELLQSYEDNPVSTAKIYSLSAYVYSGAFFSANTSTINQLKNSGSLRYFQGDSLISNFSEYNTNLQRLKSVEDRNAYLNETIRGFLTQFLDLKSISRFTVSENDDSSFNLSSPVISRPLKLYKKNREYLDQYANLCTLKQLDWNTRISLQKRVFISAHSLINSLKKEYHLN